MSYTEIIRPGGHESRGRPPAGESPASLAGRPSSSTIAWPGRAAPWTGGSLALLLTICSWFLICPRASAGEEEPSTAEISARARELLERTWALALAAPDFGKDKTWLNVARPLGLKEDLAGRVVLVDFWTYCCINCMHVLPDLEHLEKKYATEPFTVVGCHSAKFLNEAEAANVRQAVLRYNIAHPVVVDREFEIWRSFGASSWPTFLLIGADGRILAQVSGEGQRDVLDALVGQALELYRKKPGTLQPKPIPVRLESTLELARELRFPGKLAIDAEGRRLAVSDSGHHRVVLLTLEGRHLRTFGSGAPGLVDGAAGEARFRAPQGLIFQGDALLVADTENHALRRVDLASGQVSTLAGNGRQGQDRDGLHDAREVSLSSPWDLLSHEGGLLVAMAGPHQIWRLSLDTSKIGPIAGNGSERKADGPLVEGAFAQPSGLTRLGGIIYVADSESSSVRAIDLPGNRISTVVGGHENPRNLFEFGDEDGVGLGKRLQHPLAVLAHDGVLYVADTYNHKIKNVDVAARSVGPLVGSGKPGSRDGRGSEASFHEPGGLAALGRTLFVADTNNHRIRTVNLETLETSTLALEGVPLPTSAAASAQPAEDLESPLPELPGTVRNAFREIAAVPGKVPLKITLDLPAGQALTAGAPSQFRVIPLEGNVSTDSRGGRLGPGGASVQLQVGGPGKIRVQVLYYHCGAGATCWLRSAQWDLGFTPRENGVGEVELRDAPSSRGPGGVGAEPGK